MENIKIALVQMISKIGEFEHNMKKTAEFTKEATNNGTKIICFPELSMSGYSLNDSSGILMQDTSSIIKALSGMSASNGIVILVGICEQSFINEKRYIAHIVCCPDRRVYRDRKTHIGESERKIFSEGN